MGTVIALGVFMPIGVTRHDTQGTRDGRAPARMPHKVFLHFVFWRHMNSSERREARFQRRKAAREAKRHEKLSPHDDFGRVVDFDNLYRAFSDSMRGVAWKESSQKFRANAMRNLADIRRRLLAGESVHRGFVEFTLRERGKARLIRSVHISERIVQKCLCDQALVPILSSSLIHDNGASVKGKGVHFALRRLILHMTRFYRESGSNDGYALQIDFSKFFDNVDHGTLFALLDGRIRDERVLGMTKAFVGTFGDGKSLGMGSQVSQICAIFYPDRLDHFVKEILHVKYYGRYMDDLYLIHADREYLSRCLSRIEEVCASLGITINKKKTRIARLASGVGFLQGKYRLLPSGRVLRLPRKGPTKRMRRKLTKFKSLIDSGKMSHGDLRTSYQSWRGNFRRRFDAYHRVRYMDKFYNDLFISDHITTQGGKP